MRTPIKSQVIRYTMRREIIGMYAVPFGYSLKAS
jgi:hypothetical protein